MSEPAGVGQWTSCPHCRALMTRHGDIDAQPRTPEVGDFSVCWECGKVNVFDRGALGMLTVRAATAAEAAEAAALPVVRRALAARAETYSPLEAISLARGEYR